MIVAIDGPAASGKGTLGKRIARHYGLAHLDTGLLYRAVAYQLIQAGKPLTDEAEAAIAARKLDVETLDDETLRGAEMGAAASKVAAFPGVRAALVQLQRAFAARPEGAVLDGRDIGTVICPDADAKLFVTASAEERANRRFKELASRGDPITFDEVLADIRARDERDTNRAVSPLRQAEDAALLDTTKMDIDAAFRAAVAIVDAATS
ncbi:cytidylate kinase [Terrihabitans soli]|uniref:Cytidylate kinase n=1 Tax=Terrihabitans soli TaxID=708113 RepID=A0A6S6QYH6_9HYPH|nr:(d)CMP kinase [Terrihabitans soli]BCJ92130.1 cytidylate kinase [Terrihabitans soli]